MIHRMEARNLVGSTRGEFDPTIDLHGAAMDAPDHLPTGHTAEWYSRCFVRR